MIYIFLVALATIAFFGSLDSQKPSSQSDDEREAYGRIYRQRNPLMERW